MQSHLEIVTPAASIDLITLDELKRALGITGTGQDQMLAELITRVSAEIAAYCNNRVFGYETVIETFTEISADTRRLYLSRYPVIGDDITGITSADEIWLYPDDGLLLDSLWGKLTLPNGGAYYEQTVVSYSGGYNLPDEAPPALKQAATMLMREAYFAGLRGDSSVRMIGHKESRIIYFDPNAQAAKSGGGSSGTPAQRAAADILTHFTRYEA